MLILSTDLRCLDSQPEVLIMKIFCDDFGISLMLFHFTDR